MNARQKNKLRMLKTVEVTCVDNTATWTPITAFGAAFVLYQEKIVDIEHLHVKQEADLKGITENKNNKESALINSSLIVAKPMIAFANVTNDPQLRQEIDYSEDALKKSSDADLEARCTIIKERAATHAAALVTYGVTAPMIASLGTALTDYHAVISGPRSAEAVKKQQTEEIEILFKETDIILKGQLDQLITLFKTSHPDFYGAYKNARIIVDLGGHINTYSGTVLSNKIKNILNTATDDNETFEITVVSANPLDFGRGAGSDDMGGSPVTVDAGFTKKFTALQLGPSGNKYLNVKNGSTEEGSYKVVRK
jgi:hypothetical protein